MASTTPKTPCITCGKGTGLFKCEGCSETFCTKHVVEHRQTLHYQLDEAVIYHDTLQQGILDNNEESHPLIKLIDEWERKSMEKVAQMAKETRAKLGEFTRAHKGKISEQLSHLSQRIQQARDQDDFFETDLKSWILVLDMLKEELMCKSSVSEINEDRSAPLIYPLKVITKSSIVFKGDRTDLKMKNCEDMFDACLDGVTIADNGRLIVHSGINNPVEVRGRMQYSSGVHQFRLQIEENPLETWIFFGITSKSTPMTKNSFESSSAYGWVDYNDVFLAGIRQNTQNSGQFSHTRKNDIISLQFDCDNRKVSYTNERSQCAQQLDIDINKCPFPWQLHVNLFGKNDRVRLLNVRTSL